MPETKKKKSVKQKQVKQKQKQSQKQVVNVNVNTSKTTKKKSSNKKKKQQQSDNGIMTQQQGMRYILQNQPSVLQQMPIPNNNELASAIVSVLNRTNNPPPTLVPTEQKKQIYENLEKMNKDATQENTTDYPPEVEGSLFLADMRKRRMQELEEAGARDTTQKEPKKSGNKAAISNLIFDSPARGGQSKSSFFNPSGSKKDNPDFVRNPETNKMIKKDGKLAKKLRAEGKI